MVKLNNLILPTDKKFGLFFTAVFFVSSIYFYLYEIHSLAIGFISLCVLFFVISLIKADLLHPLNKIWMSLGLLIGMIVSPIVLGLIFFGIFTPISLIMRAFGRDELRLRFVQKVTYWVPRVVSKTQTDTFKNQF